MAGRRPLILALLTSVLVLGAVSCGGDEVRPEVDVAIEGCAADTLAVVVEKYPTDVEYLGLDAVEGVAAVRCRARIRSGTLAVTAVREAVCSMFVDRHYGTQSEAVEIIEELSGQVDEFTQRACAEAARRDILTDSAALAELNVDLAPEFGFIWP